MAVRCLKSHLDIVACGHNLIAWGPFGTYATGDWLEEDVIVCTKKERDRVSSATRAVRRAVYGALENVIGPPSKLIPQVYDECSRDWRCIDPLATRVAYLQRLYTRLLPQDCEALKTRK